MPVGGGGGGGGVILIPCLGSRPALQLLYTGTLYCGSTFTLCSYSTLLLYTATLYRCSILWSVYRRPDLCRPINAGLFCLVFLCKCLHDTGPHFQPHQAMSQNRCFLQE